MALNAISNVAANVAANVAIAVENTESAGSQLLDLDNASEMSNFISKQILIQAGISMLAQANSMPDNLLGQFQCQLCRQLLRALMSPYDFRRVIT